MSLDEIKRLEAEEMELSIILAEKKKAREELQAKENERTRLEKEAEEAKKPLEIFVAGVSYSGITVHARWREDIQEIWKSTSGHVYNGYLPDGTKRGKNLVPLREWKDTLGRLMSLENSVIVYAQNVEKAIEFELNTPPWEIDLADNLKNFIVRIGPRQVHSKLGDLNSISWDDEWKTAKVSLSEGWRIAQLLENVEGVIYSEGAKLIIFEQVERRSRLDKLAMAEDSDDPRLDILTHQVFATKHGEKEPTWDTFRNHLRPFQRVGITFALEANGRMLLGDATGLGKTWQEVGYCEVRRLLDNPKFMSVFSVKASNIPNWEREIIRLTGIEPVVCYNGHYQMSIVGKIIKERPTYIIISHETLGTYEYLNTEDNMKLPENERDRVYFWAEFFKHLEPDFLGIDEAHQMKNPSTNRSTAMMKLAGIKHIMPATASPIKSRVKEFFPSLFMVDPVSFQSATKFEQDWTVGGKYPKRVDKLQELLKPVFLRRTKAQVQKDLPPINRITKYVEMSKDAKVSYDEVLDGLWKQLTTFNPTGLGGTDYQAVTGILATITRLRQVCSDDKINFTADLATELVDEHSDEERQTKVLIFSQFKGTALSIANRLGGEAVCTVERKFVNGEYTFESLDSRSRDNLFESSRYDKNVKFIVTTSAAKEGHNIEYCDYVIFNDQYWTPEDHIQCEGRAYGRLSNPHPIDSFYVVSEVNIETWMQELLDTKLQIIQTTVDGIEASRDATGSLGMALIKKLKESMGR